jgi:endonuclease/exonuclease/phosphatase (EEP) superfamily protein YafD
VQPWANNSAAWSRLASRAARCSAGRVLGIVGPHTTHPTVNPTHETQ